MRQRSVIIVLSCVAASIFTAIVTARLSSVAPLDMRVVSVAELGNTNLVTVEFRRTNPSARFSGTHKVQAHLGGRWQSPVTLARFGEDDLLARTNREQAVFSVPADADALRFSVRYRVGPRPYCQAYFFLQRQGLSQRFPKLSHAVLKCVPQQPRLKRAERELVIPKRRHSQMTSLDGGQSISFLSASQRRDTVSQSTR